MPPLAEIQEIVRVTDITMGQIALQEDAVAQSLKHSAAQRQNILRAAFASELTPQDPNDESAGVLLERICVERTAQIAVKKPRGCKKIT